MDQKTLIKLSTRNPRAQRAVYESHCDRLMYIIMRYVDDIPYAEESLQDTFIQIFDKILQYDSSKGSFENWSHRIAVNQALMKLRKVNTMKYKFSDLLETKSTIANHGLDNLNYEDLICQVEQLLPKQRALIQLRLIEGYPFSEISELLNISQANTRKILSRAKKTLIKNIDSSENTSTNLRANQL